MKYENRCPKCILSNNWGNCSDESCANSLNRLKESLLKAKEQEDKNSIRIIDKLWRLEISEDFRNVLRGYLDDGDFEYVARRFMELLK